MEFQAVSNGATRRRVIRYNTCTYASDFKFLVMFMILVFHGFCKHITTFWCKYLFSIAFMYSPGLVGKTNVLYLYPRFL